MIGYGIIIEDEYERRKYIEVADNVYEIRVYKLATANNRSYIILINILSLSPIRFSLGDRLTINFNVEKDNALKRWLAIVVDPLP